MSDLLFSEEWAVVGVINPSAAVPGTTLCAAIDASKYEQFAFVLAIGARGAGHEVDFAVHSSATSGGAYAIVTGKSITQVVDTSPVANAQNKQYIINVRSGEITNSNQYLKATVTIGTNSPTTTCPYTVLVFGKGRHRPSSDTDLSSVSQIVA